MNVSNIDQRRLPAPDATPLKVLQCAQHCDEACLGIGRTLSCTSKFCPVLGGADPKALHDQLLSDLLPHPFACESQRSRGHITLGRRGVFESPLKCLFQVHDLIGLIFDLGSSLLDIGLEFTQLFAKLRRPFRLIFKSRAQVVILALDNVTTGEADVQRSIKSSS